MPTFCGDRDFNSRRFRTLIFQFMRNRFSLNISSRIFTFICPMTNLQTFLTNHSSCLLIFSFLLTSAFCLRSFGITTTSSIAWRRSIHLYFLFLSSFLLDLALCCFCVYVFWLEHSLNRVFFMITVHCEKIRKIVRKRWVKTQKIQNPRGFYAKKTPIYAIP